MVLLLGDVPGEQFYDNMEKRAVTGGRRKLSAFILPDTEGSTKTQVVSVAPDEILQNGVKMSLLSSEIISADGLCIGRPPHRPHLSRSLFSIMQEYFSIDSVVCIYTIDYLA